MTSEYAMGRPITTTIAAIGIIGPEPISPQTIISSPQSTQTGAAKRCVRLQIYSSASVHGSRMPVVLLRRNFGR